MKIQGLRACLYLGLDAMGGLEPYFHSAEVETLLGDPTKAKQKLGWQPEITGHVIREDKKGYIPGETPRILERLDIDPAPFIATTARMLQQFSTAIGTLEHLTAHCATRNIAFLRGMSAARALFKRKAA